MTPLLNQKRWPLDAVCPGDALGSDPRGTERCLETQPVVARPVQATTCSSGYEYPGILLLIRFQGSGGWISLRLVLLSPL